MKKGSQPRYKKPKKRNKKRIPAFRREKEVVVLNRTTEPRMGLKSPAAQAQALVEAMADISYPRSKRP